jgi:hypothetical protein
MIYLISWPWGPPGFTVEPARLSQVKPLCHEQVRPGNYYHSGRDFFPAAEFQGPEKPRG